MTDDFTPLTEPDHYLGWLGDDPAAAVREQMESILRKQVPTATLDWVRLVGEPEFLTGGRKLPDDPSKLIITRAALAVPFTLQVSSEDGTEWLRGVFSWVAVGLDGGQRRDRAYFDLDAEMEGAKEQLVARIYELDAPKEAPETPG
jgi:hypothetical protein